MTVSQTETAEMEHSELQRTRRLTGTYALAPVTATMSLFSEA